MILVWIPAYAGMTRQKTNNAIGLGGVVNIPLNLMKNQIDLDNNTMYVIM